MEEWDGKLLSRGESRGFDSSGLPGMSKEAVKGKEGYLAPSWRDAKHVPIDNEEIHYDNDVRVEAPKLLPAQVVVAKKTRKAREVKADPEPVVADPVTVASSPCVPQAAVVKQVRKSKYLLTVNTPFGPIESDVYDYVATPQVLVITYDATKRGNKFIPIASDTELDIIILDLENDEETGYTVIPMGLSFTLPRAELLTTLLQLKQ